MACSPNSSEKKFGKRDNYHSFGPQLSDEGMDISFVEDFDALKDFRGELSSHQIFDSVQQLFEAGLVADKVWEERSHRLAYQIRSELYQLDLLRTIIDDKKALEKESEALENLWKAVVYHDAFSLNSYYSRLKKLLSEEEFKAFQLKVSYAQAKDLLEFSSLLSKTRFYGGDLSRIYTKLNKAYSPLQKKAVHFSQSEQVLSFLQDLETATINKAQNSGNLIYAKSLNLMDQFYLEEQNYSSANVESSAYIEAALGLYGGDVYQAWSSSFQKIRKQVKAAFREVKIEISKPDEADLYLPERVIEKLKSELDSLGDKLLEQGVDPVAVTQVEQQIRDLYPLIQFAIKNLSDMDEGNRLRKNVELFDSVIDQLEQAALFPEAVINTVNNEVLFPKGIERLINLIEQKQTSEELKLALAQTVIIRIWKYKRASIDAELEKLLDRMDASDDCYTEENKKHLVKYLMRKDAFVFSGMCTVDGDLDSDWDKFWYKVDKLNAVFKNKKLVYALYFLGEKDLNWLARVDEENLNLDDSGWDYFTKPILKFISSSIRSTVQDMGEEEIASGNHELPLANFVRMIESSVNLAFLEKLSLRLTDELSRFDVIIENQILSSIDKVDFPATDFYHHLKQIARTELKGQIFENRKNLKFSLYEADKVNLAYGLDGWEFRRAEPKHSSFRTGALVLTSAISARALSFWNYKNMSTKNLRIADERSGLRKRAYDLINKSLSLLGTRDYFGRMKPGLIINEESRLPLNLDIYTYAYEKEVFSLPDRIWLGAKGDYYDLSLVSEQRGFSVDGQAGLLQAGTHLMQLMADWEESPLDEEIHQIEYQGVGFFPKESLIEMGLGIASVVLRNLTKKGLVLFDKNRQVLKVDADNVSEVASQVTSAALVSLQSGEELSEVKTREMAKYMLALYDFIREAERVSLSRANSMIFVHPSLGTSVQTELAKATSLLRKLYIGMANFLSSRTQSSDFLFSDSFDLKTNRASDAKSLSTQVYARLALLRAKELWGADLYLWAAIDNYFATNLRFLDKRTGLYKQSNVWAPYLLSLNYRAISEFLHNPEVKKWLSEDSFVRMQRIHHQHEKALESSL